MLVPMSENFSGISNPIAPTKPSINPIIVVALVFALNNNTPMISVKRGVRELSIPVSEELMPVSAAVKRNAGIKFPNIPIPRNLCQSFSSDFFTYFKPNGRMKRNAMNIRSAATCTLLNASSPRFMRMNELPHTSVSTRKINQFQNFVLKFTEDKNTFFVAETGKRNLLRKQNLDSSQIKVIFTSNQLNYITS